MFINRRHLCWKGGLFRASRLLLSLTARSERDAISPLVLRKCHAHWESPWFSLILRARGAHPTWTVRAKCKAHRCIGVRAVSRVHKHAYPLLERVYFCVNYQKPLGAGVVFAHVAGVAVMWCACASGLASTALSALGPGARPAVFQWCRAGECVSKTPIPEHVDGDWSPWGVWSMCSRTCGTGARFRQRKCDNPP